MQAPAIDPARLLGRIDELAAIGAIEGGGCARLALTEEDRQGRDRVAGWMRELGLDVRIDAIGNMFGLTEGWRERRPVLTGSHIDTVRTGGRYDGNYGGVAGLEAIAALRAAGRRPARPLGVGVFTNEEGSRFQPDMMGSLVHAGGLDLADAHAARDRNGVSVGTALRSIGYLGDEPPGFVTPHAFVELHIEQGPVLDAEGVAIGAVEDLQGVSGQEVPVAGQSNQAGTTPMRLRRDAGYVAGAATAFLHDLAEDMGGAQVCTVGRIDLHPNYINVIPARATFTADLRNTDAAKLREAEERFAAFLGAIAARTGTSVESRRLARFAPVVFDPRLVAMIADEAQRMGLAARRMTSGAGHDALMMARICPSAMIFVPSVAGISHNPAEHTAPADLVAGAALLLRVLTSLAEEA